ncbi:MAG: acylneuraminate cytidylyltransferase family protein [Betaproteobacteria bacterium]
MINGTRVLGVIPARGRSKGVPGKNIRIVGGKPLIAWTIEAAQSSEILDRVVLSSDDLDIISIAKKHNCDVPFVRDPHLAQDETPTIDVVLDALNRCPAYEWVVLLQPTSPLRTYKDIDEAIQRCAAFNAPSCVSVCLAQESPYWMFTLKPDAHLAALLPNQALTRRQDLPPVYSLNGAIYVAKTEWLKRERKFLTSETIAYEMPIERSLDIDTESDFIQLKSILED